MPHPMSDTAPTLVQAPETVLIAAEFDAAHYEWEYPDIVALPQSALQHFVAIGWREGRNPNAFFDTTDYLLRNADVSDADINPFYHYIRFGRDERRGVAPSASPSARTQLLFGYEVLDWIERIRPVFNEVFYRKQCSAAELAGADPLAHFAYRGWRQGRSPSSAFPIRRWLARNPALAHFLINPVLVQQEKDRGAFDDLKIRQAHLREIARAGALAAQAAAPPTTTPPRESDEPAEDHDYVALHPEYSEADIALMRREFSEPYYTSVHPDLAAHADPFAHYLLQGWREKRNPNADFDAAYYAKANPDVVTNRVNPFLHYLTSGRLEGRAPRPPGGYRRAIIETAVPPEARSRDYVDVLDDHILNKRQIVAAIAARSATGLVVACSHDCYVRSVGGTQIFIADEQAAFCERGFRYLQISPRAAKLALVADTAANTFGLRLVMDGTVLGVATLAETTAALRQIRAHFTGARHFIVHSCLGFSAASLIDLRTAVAAARAYIWLHDYATACPGFNLLRNNVEYCGAPPVDSMACRVCVYGESRRGHLAAIERIFAGGAFTVVAPSEVALQTWRAATALPVADVVVHPHMRLSIEGKRPAKRKSGPIRIAFLGHAMDAKGWPMFAALVTHLRNDPRFAFYHFVDDGRTALAGVTAVATSVSQSDRDAAVRLLAEHQIDFVAMLANWPETFSYVAHEVISAGAFLLCLESSGNVRAVAEKTGCGRVFPDIEALGNFLASDDAAGLLKTNLPNFVATHAGTSATLILPEAVRQAAE